MQSCLVSGPTVSQFPTKIGAAWSETFLLLVCFVCTQVGELLACTKPQENLPEKSFLEGRTQEGETDLTGTIQIRSILCFYFGYVAQKTPCS